MTAMVPERERVTVRIDAGIAHIALVREAQMNAFDEGMHHHLRAALERVRQNATVRVLVLTGSGRAFCAGQDLGERAAVFADGGQPDLRTSLEANYNPLIRTIAEMPIPVIAAVNGIAFGAGASLVIACDIVIAATSARFQFGFVNVGLGPDSGASWFLPRLVGQARAMDLALTGRALGAEEAGAMGLIAHVVADDDLVTQATDLAAALAARSPDALAAIKAQMRANPSLPLADALAAERDAQAALGRTDAYRAAVMRFAARK